VAVGAQTLAGTDRRRLRSGLGRWCTDPWPILTGEDGVVTVAISWVDIVIDFWRGGEGQFESNHL